MYSREKLPEFSPSVVVEPWRKALMDAAEYIRVHGHCKGALEDDEGRVCVLGALHKIRCGSAVILEAGGKLQQRIGGAAIGWWSDGTPTESVLRVLTELAHS